MMGSRQRARSALFHDFSLEDSVPGGHVLRTIDGVIDLSSVRTHLTKLYSATGRFSINPELMMRMLLQGYVMNNRSERRLCEKVHQNLAYH
jgi:transposase